MANAQLAACRLVHAFIGESVRPIVDRKRNALPWTKLSDGMITRSHGWLRSLLKLDHPGDFQGVVAGSRALFEIALDFVLILHQEKGKFIKLLDWERSAQLQWAERQQVRDGDAAAFVKNYKQTIEALRVQHWPNKKGGGSAPQRWTGRRIHEDALAADALNAPEAAILAPDNFAEYAQNRYPMNCWYVHGSGMIALHDCDHGYLPTVVGFGRRDAIRFSLVTARCALAVFGANDAIAEARFAALETEIVKLVHAAVT